MSVDIAPYLDLSFWLKRDDVSCRDAEGSEIPADLAKIETVSLWCCKVCKTSWKAHRCANTESRLMLVWSKEAGFNTPVITTIVENAAPTKRGTVEDDSDFFAALESGPVEPTNPPVPDLAEIQRAYDLLVAPLNRVVELRSPASTKGTWGGVYDTAELVQDTFALSGKAGVTSVYWTIQSIDPAKQKPLNGVKPYCKKGELTNDEQVSRYLHLAIDVDPNREGVISSTDEEKACAWTIIQSVRDFLTARGISSILADSGNGFHALVRVDLEVNTANIGLMENLLEAFAKCFNNERAHVDESIFNPSRILKAYGTVARKGERTAERPWRVARLLDVPADMSVVSENELRTLLSDLEAKAAALPQIGLAPARATVSTNGNREKTRKVDSAEPIPFGQHDTTLHAIAWELRWDDLEEEQIYERLIEICETRCEGYGTDYKEMCRKHAHSAAEQPKGTDQREQRNKNLLVSGKTLDQLEAESNAPKSHVASPRMIPTYNLTFKYPQVQGSSFDFVLGTRMGANEGWFPLGEPSLIAGPSGSNKSTLMLDLLEKQSRGEDFLGHPTFKRPFAIMAIDRGKSAQERTAARMRINTAEMPEPIGLPSVQDGAALQVILQEIEGCNPMPSLVFIEGCDMLVSDPSKIQVVSPFLDGIRRIATHYHLAIVMSVGSAKTKVGEGYIAKRDNVFGSIAWGRMTETVAVLQYVEGDDTDSRRLLSVMLRNSAPEKYKMTMRDGRLVLDKDEEIEPPEMPRERVWFLMQKEWFTEDDAAKALKVSQPTAHRYVADAHKEKILKTRKTKVGTNGRPARQYLWNDDDLTNPEGWRSRG